MRTKHQEAYRDSIMHAKKLLYSLLDNCPHSAYISSSQAVSCAVCDIQLGWLCYESPISRICHYKAEFNKVKGIWMTYDPITKTYIEVPIKYVNKHIAPVVDKLDKDEELCYNENICIFCGKPSRLGKL